eukprot:Gregarina_sp_Poly_1__5682@NODE_29_length_19459_cov_103_994070_g26_i0_p3_GENE_NODE_29_length_19459_cov_103_994070_g26_i0NODE_29_length_19459_cov_103_994070_g26_i0_p3_ORF_typecomplete_len755_score59_34EGF_CA/PF07645_15/53EGF_CA/PF07645_15/2_6e09EGF_CA/PF07645_15/9_9e12EGF_CA/PF07645_15/8_9e09EGF_CA/PF07645_15/0_00016EGF_CA/PF07645_15/2_2e07EGF_CA/PF07645_15/2_8e07EGF_CA/PF07645_15/1_2e09EGF_CA/PF07645_15/1_3e05EGF_CA/PF07645_15/1_2e05EGF_CA/PF07645_15/9_9e02FXa_inhibition/PF14670_6/25FXa_inhibitio
MAGRPLLGSMVGSLLSSNLLAPQAPVPVRPNPNVVNSGSPSTLQRVVHNLDHCDVKTQGMCCYFPNFCDPIAKCISDPNPANVFELAATLPKCVCPEGFEGDGKTRGVGCQNINECARGLSMCEHKCVDLIPGYQCQCLSGYRLNSDGRTCGDIDECSEGTSGCAQLCVNTKGGFQCACRDGYRLNENGSDCDDIDECEEARVSGYSVCQFDDLCVNLKGSFQCNCPRGLSVSVLDPRRCEDIDECLDLEDPCPNSLIRDSGGALRNSQFCENTAAGWSCQCLVGTAARANAAPANKAHIENADLLLKTSQELEAVNDEALHFTRELYCDDVDECAVSPGPCDSQSMDALPVMCVNTWRSYDCVCMQDGSTWDDDQKSCVDVDECELGLCGTSPHIVCRNENPGFQCSCEDGFILDGDHKIGGQCHDINECLTQVAKCPDNSDCVNFEGGWDCRCREGFEAIRLDEQTMECRDIDECSLGFCPSPCLNLPGTYVCGCALGEMSPGAHVESTQVMWQTLAQSIYEEISLDKLNSSEQQIMTRNFMDVIHDSIGCNDIDECALTWGLMCGEGCHCRNQSPGFTCHCPDKHKVTSTLVSADIGMALTLAKSLGEQLHSLPIGPILNQMNPKTALKAFLTLVPDVTAPWMVTHIPWELSTRFDISEVDGYEEFGDLAGLPYQSIMAVYGDALYHTTMQTCVPSDVCLQRNYNPCPQTARSCCRSLDNGTRFDCLASMRLIRLGSSPQCPPGTVDRSAG